ncbi:MAG TPA: hypothetical protein PLG57_10450 [Bacteroidia bacterium]|jgi:transcription elongation GreA/GreB family factor|nr:hypothetical protein [Bacteroidia bacterium]HQF28908.1 hypothetical protein [Bacteroidia bacterium]HQK97388.1 hypothetical protein [Bacteroidia bacterium]
MNREELMALSTDEKLVFKQRFIDHCHAILNDRVAMLEEAVKDAQDSANNEDKSSAGDKHETARALSQNSRDLNASVLAEALKERDFLLSLKDTDPAEFVKNGAVVLTSSFNAFVCINLGKVDFEDLSIMSISPSAPIAQKMLKLKKADKFNFNNRETLLLDVF